MNILEFSEMPWARRSFRGSEFGERNNTFLNFKGRGPWVVHCKTGNKPEKIIKLTADVHGSFGMEDTGRAVFSVDPEGKAAGLDFARLFLSDDGTDQWPASGFGRTVIRGADCALEANTSYYFYIPAIVGGHPSQRPGIRIGYSSMSKDDVEEFPAMLGEPMFHYKTGEAGMWYPLLD